MKVKTAFRVYTLYQVTTAISILSSLGCLTVEYYKATGVLFGLAIILTVLGILHLKRLYRRCERIEQGYGDPEEVK